MKKDIIIRSSTAEFLIFEEQKKQKGIEVRFEDGDLWLTQKLIAELFDTTRNNITMHLSEIYNSLELEENLTSKDFLLVQKEGNREVKRNVKHYNLDAIISVGFKVNSSKAVQFRRWAIYILKEFSKKGYIIDKKRMENGLFFDEDYFESLLAEIREIRLSERRFYQKITDIYTTSIDYDKKAPLTLEFFKKVQNKMHYAVSHNTAAEIIYNRVDSKKEYMGLTSWENSPSGKILETDVVIAKNYLSKKEIENLELIVSAFLDLAESRAKRNIAMTMQDWILLLDKYLLLDDRNILKNAGKISSEIAKDKALTEFEKYRVKQDKLFLSDFDDFLELNSKVNVHNDSNLLTINTYNKIAIKYKKEFQDDFSDSTYIDEFLKQVKGDRILDIGCGIGNLTKYVAKKDYIVDGIDLSDEMLKVAIKINNHKNINYYNMDMRDINLNKKYDGIMLLYSLFHITKKEVLNIFPKICKMLNKFGKMILILQEGNGEKIIEEPLDINLNIFINYYTSDEIMKILEINNIKVVSQYYKETENEFEMNNRKIIIIAEKN